MKTKITALFLIAVLVFPLAASGGEGDIKERFKKRKPVIDDLKDNGIVGETNGGLIVVMKGKRVDKKILETIQAENDDRLTIYRQIAQRHGISAAVVGKRRAAKIARIASPGHWLQNPRGEWYRK